MSAVPSPDMSDIHGSAVSTVAETLSVTTSDPGAVVTAQTIPTENQSNVPTVGASVSVQDSSSATSISERSSALLNLASSCSLTEILNVQQQALEQFQCQLQLAQQNEAINQRLDAIERTLNNLIQQKAQEDASRSVQQVVQAAAAAAQVAHGHVQQQGDGTGAVVVGLNGAGLRPEASQQLQTTTLESGGGEGTSSLSPTDDKRKKLPRELCAKVRSTYNALNLDFKIDERFLSPANQRVTDSLIDQVYTDSSGLYSVKEIKRAVHRYYESRRRLGIEELPDRQEKAAEQRKKRKYRARQQRSYDRRKKFVRDGEMQYWDHITPACMTEESDSENGEKIITHDLLWRSEFLNQFIQKLDSRYEKSKKPGTNSTVKRERLQGLPSTSQPSPTLPSWMINPDYKGLNTSATAGTSQSSSMCLEPSAEEVSAADVTTYSSLIDVQDVQDESSDFELPETVVS